MPHREMVEENIKINDWTFWYDYIKNKSGGQEEYEQNIHEICNVNTIPKLMYVLDNLEEPAEWPISSNLHFFRRGIQPAWEDINNIEGGKWLLELDNTIDYDLSLLWKKTVAFCASEIMEDDSICGCVFSPRKYVNRLALWTNVTSDYVITIGNMWKRELGIQSYKDMGFRAHKDALQGGVYWSKSLYSLN